MSEKPVSEAKPAEPTMSSYKKFKKQIEEALRAEPKGLTWTEIKNKLGMSQKVPNNKWVRMMEKDIGLIREAVKDRGIVWKLK